MILSGIKHLMLGDALKTILFLEDGSVVTVDRLSEPRARVFLFYVPSPSSVSASSMIILALLHLFPLFFFNYISTDLPMVLAQLVF